MVACLVLASVNGRINTAIDHTDMPNRLRCVLGTELKRIPLEGDQPEMDIDALVLTLLVVGKLN